MAVPIAAMPAITYSAFPSGVACLKDFLSPLCALLMCFVARALSSGGMNPITVLNDCVRSFRLSMVVLVMS